MYVQQLLSHLLPVLAPAAVQTLDDGGGVAEDEGEARGPGDHRDHGQPEVGHVLGGEPPVTNAEHVRHRLEARMNILQTTIQK